MDRYPVNIVVGGRLTRADAGRLAAFIAGDGWSTDWGCEPFDPKSADDLLGALDENGHLGLYDEDRRDSTRLDALLHEIGAPYNEYTEFGDGRTLVTCRRPGLPDLRYDSCDGCRHVPRAPVRGAVEALVRWLEAGGPPGGLDEVVGLLNEAAGPDEPDLPPFEATD